MIVRNGAVILACKSYNSAVPADYELTKIDGTTISSSASASLGTARNLIFDTVSSANTGVVMNIGTGTTAVTADDYDLDEPLTSDDYSCSFPSPVTSIAATNDGDMLYTFAFTAITSFTITEIGIFYLGTQGKILLARTILPTPRPVTAGETFSFVYKLKF